VHRRGGCPCRGIVRFFEDERIKTFYCDQLDGAAIRALWSQPDVAKAIEQGGMDIIVDDGLHTFDGNVSFLEGSLGYLRPGGFYVVEDIPKEALDKWRARLDSVYSRDFPNYEFALVELPNSLNDDDNNLLIVRRTE
jgi:hypothetical protein